jgi:NADH:ubiquinone oxidoreductase subunit 2 (subunit N)
MVEILDVVLPILTLVIASLLTVPIFRLIRKSSHKTALTTAWFLAVFLIAGITVANLALNYFGMASPPQLNLTLDGSNSIFSSAFLVDAISVYMAIIVVALSAVVMLYSVFFVHTNDRPSERYFAIMLMTTAGAAFLMLYKKNAFSINATMKFLVMVIIASAFVLFGLSLVYSLTGTLNYIALSQALTQLADSRLLIIAFVFIAAGYAIEAAIVPFHFWLPDAYTAAPAPSAAFLSALVDQGSYYILIRVLLFIVIPTAALDWPLMLAIMAALTMLIGTIFALAQTTVKRLMAYKLTCSSSSSAASPPRLHSWPWA